MRLIRGKIGLSVAGRHRGPVLRTILAGPLCAAWLVSIAGCAHQKPSQITPEQIMSSPEVKLNSVILTEVSLQNAPVQDAVRYLTEHSRQADPDQVGVVIQYRTFQLNEFPRRVTLKMAQATVGQALTEVCRQTRCKYMIQKNTVFVLPQDTFNSLGTYHHNIGP